MVARWTCSCCEEKDCVSRKCETKLGSRRAHSSDHGDDFNGVCWRAPVLEIREACLEEGCFKVSEEVGHLVSVECHWRDGRWQSSIRRTTTCSRDDLCG